MDATNKTPIDFYKAMRAEGKSPTDILYALMDSGLSVDEAIDIEALARTGKPAPKYTYEDGTLTPAGYAWHRGQEARLVGE